MQNTEPVVGMVWPSAMLVGQPLPYTPLCRDLLTAGARVIGVGGSQNIAPDPEGLVHNYVEVVPGADTLQLVRTTGAIALDSALCLNGKWKEEGVPCLNTENTRSFIADGAALQGVCRELGPHTEDLFMEHEINRAVRGLAHNALVVVKPMRGDRLRRLHLNVAGKELRAKIHHLLHNDQSPLLAQERLYHSPWPERMWTQSPSQQRWLQEAQSRELRIFAVNNKFFPIARVQKYQDYMGYAPQHIEIDGGTVPTEACEMAKRVVTVVKASLRTKNVALAIDLMYGTSSVQPNPRWYLMSARTEYAGDLLGGDAPDLEREVRRAYVEEVVRMAGSDD